MGGRVADARSTERGTRPPPGGARVAARSGGLLGLALLPAGAALLPLGRESAVDRLDQLEPTECVAVVAERGRARRPVERALDHAPVALAQVVGGCLDRRARAEHDR